MKTLKLVSVITAVLLATACGKQNQNPNGGPASKSNAQGGIEGGGGGTLIVNPIGTYKVHLIVKQHKNDIRLLLNGMSSFAFMESPSKIEKKLFLGKVTILDLLDQVEVEIRDTKPCYDANGEEKDASIFASKPNTICLSAFRIAPKVIEERAKTEILALLIHEYSHFLGTTEEEAESYQKWCAALLAKIGEQDAMEFTRAFVGKTHRLAREVRAMADEAESATDEQLQLRSDAISDAKQRLDYTSDNFMHALNFQGEELLFAKVHVLSDLTLYANTLSGEFASAAKERYDEIFATADSLTLNEYHKLKGYRSLMYGDRIRLEKIKSRKDLKAQLDSLSKYFDRLAEVAEALHSTRPIPKFDDVIDGP